MSEKKRVIPATLLTLILAFLILMPVLAICVESFQTDDGWNFLAPLNIMAKQSVLTPFINTLILGVLVVIGATLVAFGVAYLMAKTDMGKYQWLDIIIMVPFMTPPYIASMGWILFMQDQGFLNQLLPFTHDQDEFFFSLFGLVTIMSLHLFPFIYLILRNALMNLGQSMDEAAMVHGAGFFRRLRKVTIPLLTSAYAMGSLLVFVKTIGEFGTPATFGRKIGFYVLTTEIHKAISTWPISFSKATSLSYFLLIACLVIWYFQSVLGRRTYSDYGTKTVRHDKRILSKGKKALAFIYIGIILLIAIGVPYFSIVATSLIKLRGYGLSAGNFTLQHYKDMFAKGSDGLEAFATTLQVAIIVSIVCSLIGIGVSLIVIYGKGPIRRVIDFISMLPNMLPSVVLTIGMILFWNSSWNPLRIYNTMWMILLAYIAFFLPFSVQYVKSSLGQVPMGLIHAAQVCGGERFYNFRRIILPLIIPGVLAGWMMTFTIAFRELVAPLLLIPPGKQMASTYIYSQFEQGEASLGMAMAVVSVLLTTSILIVMNIFAKRQVSHAR